MSIFPIMLNLPLPIFFWSSFMGMYCRNFILLGAQAIVFRVNLSVCYSSVSLDKCVLCVYHYSIIQTGFTALKFSVFHLFISHALPTLWSPATTDIFLLYSQICVFQNVIYLESPTEEHHGCFQVLEIMNKAAVSIYVQDFVWTSSFSSFKFV